MISSGKKHKHWSDRVHESVVSRNKNGQLNLVIKGGAEEAKFPFFSNVKQEKVIYHSGKILDGEVLLKVNDQSVAGLTLFDLNNLIKQTKDPVRFKTVKEGQTLKKDLKQYLSERFNPGSDDHELQAAIRDNLYLRTIPCTTRPPRDGETDGVEYTFLTVKEFEELEKAGALLESGLFEGDYYGSPKPSPVPLSPPSNSPQRNTSYDDAPGNRQNSEGKREKKQSNGEMQPSPASLAVGENVRQSFTNSEINVVSGNQNITNIITYIVEAPNESHKNLIGNSKSITVFGERIGGDTKVYKGRCVKRNIDLAIKIMDKCSKSEREAKLLLTLDHENIVKVVEVGAYPGIVPQIFIAMELCHENLSDYIGNDVHLPLSFQKSFDFSKQLVTAVVYLHDKRIVHRDLKPWNILISNCGEKLKVTDMGLSRTVDMGKTATTVTHILAGSNGFKAPETYETNATYHYSSDIFPLGINIYFIFTSGKHPFGDDPHHWVSNIIKNKRADLTQIPKLEPKTSQLEVLLKSMLKKNGRKRPTAKKVLDSKFFMANSNVPSEDDGHRHEDERAVFQNPSDQAELALDGDSSNTGQDLKTFGRTKMKAGTLIEHNFPTNALTFIEHNFPTNAGDPNQAPSPGQEHEHMSAGPEHRSTPNVAHARVEATSATPRPAMPFVPAQAPPQATWGMQDKELLYSLAMSEPRILTNHSAELINRKYMQEKQESAVNRPTTTAPKPNPVRSEPIPADKHPGKAEANPQSKPQPSQHQYAEWILDHQPDPQQAVAELSTKTSWTSLEDAIREPQLTTEKSSEGPSDHNGASSRLIFQYPAPGGNFGPIQARVHPAETYQGHVPGGLGHSANAPDQVMDLFQPVSSRTPPAQRHETNVRVPTSQEPARSHAENLAVFRNRSYQTELARLNVGEQVLFDALESTDYVEAMCNLLVDKIRTQDLKEMLRYLSLLPEIMIEDIENENRYDHKEMRRKLLKEMCFEQGSDLTPRILLNKAFSYRMRKPYDDLCKAFLQHLRKKQNL